MIRRSDRAESSGKDPHYVHTSRDGRKYIKPNEFIRLDEFKRSMDRLRKAVEGSNLIRKS